MSEFFAQPYDMDAKGFYFSNVETFQTKMAEARNAYGQKVEEFEIQFIDGELIDCQLASAYGINQANIASFMEHETTWDEWQKIRFILAVGELGGGFDHLDCDPDTIVAYISLIVTKSWQSSLSMKGFSVRFPRLYNIMLIMTQSLGIWKWTTAKPMLIIRLTFFD